MTSLQKIDKKRKKVFFLKILSKKQPDLIKGFTEGGNAPSAGDAAHKQTSKCFHKRSSTRSNPLLPQIH